MTSALALDSKLVGSTVTAYVAWTKEGCEGVQVSTVVNSQVADLGCVPAEAADVVPGKVALAVPAPRHRLARRGNDDLALLGRAEDLVQGLTTPAGHLARTGTMPA